MKRTQQLVRAAVLGIVTTTMLVACGGGDDDPPPKVAVTEAVPADAATSSSVATGYVAELSAVPASTTDTLEPVAVPEMLAQDDSGEPATVN